MNIYDIAIAPNAGRQIDVQADYIYFRTGSAGGGDTTIVFQPISGGEGVYLQPGQAYKMPAAMRGKVVSWIIRNLKGEGTIEGVLLMGEGEFQDNRISGAVEVIDGGKNRTRAGIAFWSGIFRATATNLNPTVQLFNPVSSGKVLVVEQLVVTATVSGGVRGGIYNQALPTLTNAPINKLSSGPQSVAKHYSDDTAAKPWATMFDFGVIASQAALIKLSEPILLMPGYGLCMHAGGQAGQAITANIEFYEEAI